MNDWDKIRYTDLPNENTNELRKICHNIDMGNIANLYGSLCKVNKICKTYKKQENNNYIDINYDNHKIILQRLVSITLYIEIIIKCIQNKTKLPVVINKFTIDKKMVNNYSIMSSGMLHNILGEIKNINIYYSNI